MTTPFAAVSEPLWIYTLMRFIGFSKSSFTMSDGIRLPVPGGRFMKISSNSWYSNNVYGAFQTDAL